MIRASHFWIWWALCIGDVGEMTFAEWKRRNLG